MSKTIKWATYENADASKTMKQHAFQSVTTRQKYTGTVFNIAESLCGRIRVGEGDTLSEAATIDSIDDEVINLNTACKTCQRLYNNLNPTTNEHSTKA